MSDLVERLEPCPFCGQQPTTAEYREFSDYTGEIDGYAAVECHCLGVGGGLFFHFETLAEAIAAWNRRAENPELTRLRSEVERLTTLTARTREVLAPFVGPFVRRRDAYARRYSDTVLGYANFDKMPDRWPMEKIEFLMGEFRAANTLFNELKEKDNG